MSRNYVISPSLEETIHQSGLLEKFPSLIEKPLSRNYNSSDVLQDIVYGPYNITKIVKEYALSLVNRDDLIWKFQESDEGVKDLFGSQKVFKAQRANVGDIALATGYLLPNPEEDDFFDELEEFDKGELDRWKECGFSSVLEMIMSLSAYRSREVIQYKNDQYEWVNSRGVRNVLTACIHGDPKFYQYDEKQSERVISPFGNEVRFSLRKTIGSMTQVYHSHEPSFFATFFRYAYESGELHKIMGKDGNKFLRGADNLPGYVGNYGDAGGTCTTENSNMLFRTCIPIGGNSKYRNVHTEAFGPIYSDEKKGYYEFKIGEGGELELHNAFSGKVDMIFYPEDCEDLLKGILHHCAHGHGRTSKEQILKLVRFYYSTDFNKQKKELDL